MAIHEEILEQRGILSEAIRANWQPCDLSWHGSMVKGWMYPCPDENGNIVAWRWKAIDSEFNPKYLPVEPLDVGKCHTKKGLPKTTYYFPVDYDVRKAIASSAHVNISSGEPDTLTFRTTGVHNVVNWFGETSVPSTLVEDLKRWGAKSADYWIDDDEAGMKSARKVLQQAHLHNFPIRIRRCSSHDTNDLWIDYMFNAEDFLASLDESDYVEIEPEPQQKNLFDRTDHSQPYADDLTIARIFSAFNLSLADVKNNGFTKNVPCPRHSDRRPSFGLNDSASGYCFVCGHMKAEEIAALLGIPFQRRSFDPPPQQLQHTIDLSAVPDDGGQYQSEESVFQSMITDMKSEAQIVIQELKAERLPDDEPIPSTCPPILDFGGLALYHIAGMVGMWLGATGSGKTSAAQDMAELELRRGGSVLWHSPEWTPKRMLYRDLVRYSRNSGTMGGRITFDDLLHDHMFRWEAHRTRDPIYGKHMTPTQIKQGIKTMNDVIDWSGNMYMPKSPTIKPETMFRLWTWQVDQAREHGETIRVAFIDYTQLFELENKGKVIDWQKYEDFALMFKHWCERNKIWGWLLSQPRKADDEATRNNIELPLDSGQNISAQKFNLVVAAQPLWDIENGEMRNVGVVQVLKNSTGRTGKKRNVPLYFQHLSWGFHDPRWYNEAGKQPHDIIDL